MEEASEKQSAWSRHAWLILLVFSFFAASISRALWVEDTGGYYDCAVALANGDIYPTDNNYFAYPLLIALSFLLFGKTLLAVQFAPFLCAALAPVLMVKVALRAGFQRSHAFLSAYLLLVFPFQLFHANRPLTEAIYVFFFLLVLWIFLGLKDRPRSWAFFLPALSWLLLIRYDAILFVGLAAGLAVWLALCARRLPWAWIGLGLITAFAMQVPFALLNAQRNEAKLREVKTAANNDHIIRFVQALQERAVAWEFTASNEPIPLDRERIQLIYDEIVPAPRLPLAEVLTQYCRPIAPLVSSNEASEVDPVSWLPLQKIKAWLYVGTNDPFGWLTRLGRSFLQVFPPWGIVANLLAALILGMGLQYGIRESMQQRSAFFILLLVYFVLFNALAITVIQGSVLRHLSRLAPVTILLVVMGMPRLNALTKNHFAPLVGLLLISCVAVNAAHKLTRPDLVTRPIWEMMASNPPLTPHSDQLDRQHALEAFMIERLKTRLEKQIQKDTKTFMRLDDFTDVQSGVPTDPGRIGLSGSMAPDVWIKTLKFDHPVKYWNIETWAYMQYPKLEFGDALLINFSTDGGKTWEENQLPTTKQRLFKWKHHVPGEGKQELQIRVHFQNYGQCMAYINGQWFRILSDDPEFFGTSRVHLQRYLLVKGRYE